MTFERSKMANRILIAALLAVCAPGVACNDSKGSRDGGGMGGTGGTGGSATSTACPGTLNGSCRYTGGDTCIEFTGLPDSATVAMAEATCVEDGKGTWAETACTHAGALGACRAVRGATCQGWWVYTGTLADEMARCAADGDTWVGP